MSYIKQFFIVLVFYVVLIDSTEASNPGIIPQPHYLHQTHGIFHLNSKTHYHTDTALSSHAETYLQSHLKKCAGYTLKKSKTPFTHKLSFHYAPQKIKHLEGYHLSIQNKQILIEAKDIPGFFYGVITLMQLMEPAIWQSGGKKHPNWNLPTCIVRDYPRYHWRGLMLDCSRNFFSTAYIKKFIDRMAQYKLNRFHWHLTDDEGWRIEIKHYPLLTKIGARRGPGTHLPFSMFPAMRGSKHRVESGYYTQKEIREIVTYAKMRSIEIVPEIDMPGHAKAAVTAYPSLLQDPHDTSHYRSIQKIRHNTINPGIESTYLFMKNVMAEVSALFPFSYIHLGGDEVPKGAWSNSPAVQKLMRREGLRGKRDVENYFFSRMDKILARYGKKMIAWQEVFSDKAVLRKSAVLMAWKNPKSGFRAIREGRNTIMAPVQYLYFDQQYVRSKKEWGHTWSTPVSTQKVYRFNPKNSHYLKGVHACLWSETLLNEKIADYLAWPRVLALSELAWTEEKQKNWQKFKARVLTKGFERLKRQKIHYRPIIH